MVWAMLLPELSHTQNEGEDSSFFQLNASDYLSSLDAGKQPYLFLNPGFFQLLLSEAQEQKIKYNGTKDIKNLEASLNHYQLTIQLLDKIRLSSHNPELQSILNKSHSIIEDGIEVAYQLHKETSNPKFLETAFYFSEKDKIFQRHLFFGDLNWRELTMLPEHLVHKSNRLISEIDKYENQFYDAIRSQADSLQLSIKKQLDEVHQGYVSLIADIENDYPEYFNIKYFNQIASIEVLQKDWLDSLSGLLEIFAGDKHTYLFNISKNKSSVLQLPALSHQSVTVQQWLDLLGDPTADFSLYQEVAHQLYTSWLQPVLQNTSLKNIWVIQDGYFGLLPLEALVMDKNPVKNYAELNYVLNKHTFTYGFSASHLKFKKEHPNPIQASKTFLGMAKKSSPGSSEIKSIKRRILFGDIYTGEKANKEKFIQKSPSYKVLHLPDALTQNETLSFFNEELTKEELMQLPLHTGLATLSNSPVDLGIKQTASLIRSFSEAGCQNILLSLWERRNRSESNNDLLTEFYALLTKDYSVDAALQKAKLDYISEAENSLNAHPYHWASLVHFGNNQALDLKKIRKYPIWIMVYLLSFFLILGLYIWKKSPSDPSLDEKFRINTE